MSNGMSVVQRYKSYRPEDKTAIKELMAEVEAKYGTKVELSDMVRAVEPDFETPESLRKLAA